MSNLELIQSFENELDPLWEKFLEARDAAQSGLEMITALRSNLAKQQIEIRKAEISRIVSSKRATKARAK